MTLPDSVQLSVDMITFKSVTPDDAGVQPFLDKLLSGLGFTCTHLPFANIKNLFARIGTDGPHLCFCGHTDVVPAGDEAAWKHPPYKGEIADGILYGRGIADMKGNIACFIAAAAAFIEEHAGFKGSISLLITGDEEAVATDGTVRVLDWMHHNGQMADAFLVGEPSNPKALGDEMKIGRRGSLNGRLQVEGIQGHTAYPERADNPMPRLIKLLAALDACFFDDGSQHFPATNLEVTSIDVGNSAANVIPAAGSAKFNVRFNDRWTAKTLEAKIREALDACGVPYTLTCQSNAESFLTAPGAFTDLVAAAVEDGCGRRPAYKTGGGTSDARFIAAYGAPVVEFGLSNATIHKVDEHVPVADLRGLTAVYERVLERYFGV